MIGRRAVILAAAAIVARRANAVLPVAPGGKLAFRMIRHGSEIGRHVVTFERRSDSLTVRIAIDAQVRFLSLPIAWYTHRATETWQGGTLVGLDGETDENGKHKRMNARRGSEGLVVTGSATARYIAPDSARGVTYWNKGILNGPLIGMDDGALLRPKVTLRQADAVRLASGGTITADHYTLSGAFAADVWYDQTNTWASLSLTVADGSIVHYERM